MAKKSAPTRKKSGKKQTPVGSKKESTKQTVMKSKMKAVIPKICQEKTLPKGPKKAKVKMVNLSAPSDMEIETETSAETEICNDSIDLSTKVHNPSSCNCAIFVLYTVSIVLSFTSRV